MTSTPQTKQSDLRVRFLSAVVLGPLVLGIIYLGGTAFALLGLIAAVLFLWEWFSITGTRPFALQAIAGYLGLVTASVFVFAGAPVLALVAVGAGAVACYVLAKGSKIGRWAGEGVLYSGLALYSLLVLRDGSEGLVFTYFVILVVWATDIFAYFIGRSLGGPKLWPKVSPKKTWSGAIGGLTVAVLLGVGVSIIFGMDNQLSWGVLAAGLSLASQAGDMLESGVKRRFSVKDSSQLIPGHGGIMDRIDGLVAAGICAVLAGWVMGGSLSDPISGLGL